MRNHDHDALLPAQRQNRAAQGILPVGIQIGIRLIEYHEERIAEHGARKAYSLALAG